MRIGIMLQSLHHFGGIGTYTRHIVQHLLNIDKENEYVIIYPSFGKSHTSFGKYKGFDNATEVLSESLIPHAYYWDHFVVPGVARKHGIDLIFNPFLSVPLRGNFKKVFVAHGCEWFIMPEVFWFTARYSGRLIMQAIMKAADIVISVSQNVADELVKATKLPKEKFRVIYNAPGEEFRPVKDETILKLAKEKYCLPDDFILFVGGIYPTKNFGGLIQAFHRVAHDIPHTLVVAGNTRWKSQRDMRLIHDLVLEDRVQCIGWISHEDLPSLYTLATCFIIPSFHESCSVALLEALSCGCPVIASHAGGNPEVVGDAALLVDPHSVRDIKEAILKVVATPELRRELAKKALVRAENFSWEKCARETLQIFADLA
jgi:glycosyltransferase involved in cell wall biosynthesis